jgi:hypothetical protein
MIRLFILLLAITLVSNCMPRYPKNSDLDFIYKTITENHPGIYNDQDPNFGRHLYTAYIKAKQNFVRASSKNRRKEIIEKFVESFNDSHLRVSWKSYQFKSSINYNEKSKFQISSLADSQIMWITLPTFEIDSNQIKGFDLILKKIAGFRHKKAIVFDLRGNEGGNSEYGSQIIKALFGEQLANYKICLANKYVFVDWRASVGNLNHLNYLYDTYKSSWLKDVSEGVKLSLSQDLPYFREHSQTSCNSKSIVQPHNYLLPQIIAIIDSGNVSAALDFIDELKTLEPKVKLIGLKTNADRLYMEVRSLDLPSGNGVFKFPIKVYRNRVRLDNQPYIPDIEYKDIANTYELQKFVIKIIDSP